MATKPEIKKDIKASEKPKMNFAFTRKNYMLLIVGIAFLVIGYLTLSGGGSKDPNEFSYDLFSTQRMVFAPIMLMIGYIVVAYAILVKETPASESTQESQQ
jgi:hypothetical protein